MCVCTVYVYCVRCTLFCPVAETCARLAGNFCQYLTTVTSGANSLVWWGDCCLHSVTQPYTTRPRWREQGGGLRSLPLVSPIWICTVMCPGGQKFETSRESILAFSAIGSIVLSIPVYLRAPLFEALQVQNSAGGFTHSNGEAGDASRVGNLSPAMRQGIDSWNRAWN
jgi:hypothetical protein